MNESIPGRRPDDLDGLDAYAKDMRKAEKKVAGEIDPGARALVVAVAILVAMVSLLLPHSGSASGLDVLAFHEDSDAEMIAITSQIFVYLLAIFGIGASGLALITRRWVIAWVALCGSGLACVAGMLAWWTRNTVGVSGVEPPSGVGIGLILGWIAALVITFHWARVVWDRSAYHLAIQEERRASEAAAEQRLHSSYRRLDDEL